MCGILGHFKKEGAIDSSIFNQMLNTLAHRGPDGEGIYISEDQKKALGHRRLSFLDLSENGRQPLSNPKGNIWLTFNGEIYNYKELKNKLKNNYSFKTKTDTEVILAAYEKWGTSFVQHLKGMFAIGILDEHKNKLYLFRDRFGIKPLYYGNFEGNFIFASELKAIMQSGVFPKKLNKSAIADYFVYRYIPSPKSIWENIFKLPPACQLELNLDNFEYKTEEYWQLSTSESIVDESEATTEVKTILSKSVKEHLRADVPIGSFLSGGYDSSALAVLMKNEGYPPYTFSIGFEDWKNSEHKYADLVAKHLSIPNENILANSESINLIELMPAIYDEPIADISITPTYLVSKLARKKVKAVFSGEGADEIFGGYTWQHNYYKLSRQNSLLQKIKNILSPIKTVDFYANAMAMGRFDKKELKKMLHTELHSSIPKDTEWFYRKNYNPNLSPMKSIQFMDIKCFMAELVLTKIDRASMANSLEVRVPFLDHQLFDKVLSYHEDVYLSPIQTKKLLFENIKTNLPKEILKREKQGFVGPDKYYMNIDFYKKELRASKLVKHNIIKQSYIDNLLKEEYNWKLWKILVFEKWFAHWTI
ncbi:MAG: asparagine synthase (glutamine-hydrolyzing) [Flavobacteriales bacterium]|nr:asparagine synthase (glutamine-hydrolyzing) [Flavobacteriales bacterium]|tara:strand:- start:43048 stop:44820 length:1773 start_codon:yes stop_codon:yes gene_type:complete